MEIIYTFVYTIVVKINRMNATKKIKIEVWSDVMCPFCYIGKRRLESALAQFPQQNQVEIEWKSFQLDPETKTNPNLSIHEYLAGKKGWSVEQARQIGTQVSDMAKAEGLNYQFDQAIVANSFKAHRFAHYAKTQGKGNEAEELLFQSYFTDGKNIDDTPTLVELGATIGLNATETETVLNSRRFTDEVQQDLYDAHQIGVRGVPFFVFNNKYVISGAQASDTFLGALETVWKETQDSMTVLADGASCDADGNCQ